MNFFLKNIHEFEDVSKVEITVYRFFLLKKMIDDS